MPKKRNIAILSSGKSRGSNFIAIVDYYKRENLPVNVAFLVVNNEAAPVIDKAKKLGVKVLVLSTKNMDRFENILLKACNEYKIELIALTGFLKKLSPNFIANFNNPVLNIHPALLPKYGGRGMYGLKVHQSVFEAQDNISGVTIHYVNDEYDTGEVITQKTIDISNCQSPEEVSQKVLKLEHEMYPPTIYKVLESIK